MSLRDEIVATLAKQYDQHGFNRQDAADAILSLISAHLASDAAVERAVHKSRIVGILPGRSDAEVMRLALAAALGEK